MRKVNRVQEIASNSKTATANEGKEDATYVFFFLWKSTDSHVFIKKLTKN